MGVFFPYRVVVGAPSVGRLYGCQVQSGECREVELWGEWGWGVWGGIGVGMGMGWDWGQEWGGNGVG